MKTFFKKYLPQLISLFVVLTPVFLFAGSSGATIQNPLGDENTSVQDLLLRILNLVAVVGGIVVVFMIIFSGFKMVMAKGNASEVTKAREMLTATVIGGAILLGADIIANVVVNTVNSTVGRT
ncbi:MAG: hypothetical protein A2541_01060 [Candidatus Taylorbacteria bacterium RIFOXYD2_FULL_36_9]|uniref:Uncharacterized protein n=1 Tax=Candidatus Taylorbacteria bacterium RIFOXYD2_FULL_36_9 TaxID=1802338 RepID=A0A1G2PHC6_9BACT|nr:MAG: hypothetical protein A2541_01060 [Candidatus Taylorbacteria bacterium RIFOXYD2_FULL_36_9]